MVSSDQATVDPGAGARIGAGCNDASRVLLMSAVVSWQISRVQSGFFFVFFEIAFGSITKKSKAQQLHDSQ